MRLFLLSTVSTAALIAVALPATADSNFTGVGEVSLGVGSSDGHITSNDPTVYGIRGKGLWFLSPEVNLQADLFFERGNDYVVDGWADSNRADMVGGAVHLLHPLENRARIGIAGSIWNNDVFLPAYDGKTDVTYGLGAIEGQFFGTDWTLTGQAGMFTSFECSGGEGCPATLDSGKFVRAKARYFLYDNTSVSLETMQMWGKLNGDNDVFNGKSVNSNYSKWLFEIEHKFDDTPYAGTIGLEHERNESNSFEVFNFNSDTDTIRLSFKYYLDQPTLRTNDRNGAELDTPTFGVAPETTGPLSYIVPELP